MDEYISKAAVLDTMDRANLMWYFDTEGDYQELLGDIKRIPVADVQPVKHGRWLLKFDGDIYEYRECSKCGNTGSCETPYCAQCGARMDGDVE